MTQNEKTIIQNIVKDALQRNDASDLKHLAKNNDYALSIIIDYLCKQHEKILYIKNFINE